MASSTATQEVGDERQCRRSRESRTQQARGIDGHGTTLVLELRLANAKGNEAMEHQESRDADHAASTRKNAGHPIALTANPVIGPATTRGRANKLEKSAY